MLRVTSVIRRARDAFAAIANGAPGAGFLTEGATYVGVDVAQNLAALATIPFVFMYLSAHDMGVITAAVVVTSFASLSSLALDFAVIRQYYQVTEDRRPELVSVAFTVTLVVAGAVTLGSLLLLRYGGAGMYRRTRHADRRVPGRAQHPAVGRSRSRRAPDLRPHDGRIGYGCRPSRSASPSCSTWGSWAFCRPRRSSPESPRLDPIGSCVVTRAAVCCRCGRGGTMRSPTH